MNTQTTLTIIVDNTTADTSLKAEHGFSCLISAHGERYLVDSGASDIFRHNLHGLTDAREPFEGIILSHGHYDHTGGVRLMLERGETPAQKMFVHSRLFNPHYAIESKTGELTEIGAGFNTGMVSHLLDISMNTNAEAIARSILLTGTIPRLFPVSYDQHLVTLDGTTPDTMQDEQAVIVDTPKGIVIITGCCHAGIENTLHRAQVLYPGRPIAGLVGGLHLFRASDAEIDHAVGVLQQYDIGTIVPCHCTGLTASMRMYAAMPERVQAGGAGRSFSF